MKSEDITIPDSSDIPPEFWTRAGAVVIVLIILAMVWSRPILRYGMIGAAILAGVLLVMEQWGSV